MFILMFNSIPKFVGGLNGISYITFKNALNNFKSKCSQYQISIFNTVILSKPEGSTFKATINRAITTIDDLTALINIIYVNEKLSDHVVWEMFSINSQSCKNVNELYSKIAPLRDNILVEIVYVKT